MGRLNWSKAVGLRVRFLKMVSPDVRDASTFFFSTPIHRKRTGKSKNGWSEGQQGVTRLEIAVVFWHAPSKYSPRYLPANLAAMFAMNTMVEGK
jgi:hypothetical protein